MVRTQVDQAAGRAENMATDATNIRWVRAVGRFGLCARGIIYVIIGWLAIDVALRHHNDQVNRKGALSAIASRPLGRILLIVLAIGFLSYAFWQALAAISGRRHGIGGRSSVGQRLAAAGKAVVYTALCASTIALLVGASSGTKSGGDAGPEWTARLMKEPLGRALVFAVGVVTMIVALVLIWQGVTRRFDVDLPDRPGAERVVAIIGVVGAVARGIVIGLIGLFVIEAAVSFDPRQAKGVDATLKSLAAEPHGSVLLSLVAFGLIAFGVFNIAAARYARF
jgi:hypothetical protein